MTKTTANKFVKAWQSSDHLDDVAQKLKLSKSTASFYAYQLRKLGVTLKRFARGRKASPLSKVDIKELNALCKAA